MTKSLTIEVAFATPSLQKIITICLTPESTIEQAIIASQINQFFPEYNLLEMPVGIFGKKLQDSKAYQLKDRDRIEIYRPLNKTPNQKRLDRAKNQ